MNKLVNLKKTLNKVYDDKDYPRVLYSVDANGQEIKYIRFAKSSYYKIIYN